jgi:hypothetical protein
VRGSTRRRKSAINLDDVYVSDELRAYDGWEGYRERLATTATALLAKHAGPLGPWSAELVLLNADP